MTRKEAIEFLNQYIGNECYTEKCQEAHRMAISALRPITREQVEKMRGEWKFVGSDRWNDAYECQQCGCLNMDDPNFCPTCGRPMTDKAVDILWKRLEAMQDAVD